LNILQSIHLKAILVIQGLLNGLICNVCCLRSVPSCIVDLLVVFLCSLSHLSEFDVTFIENDLLDIVCWHLPHKQTLCVSIFISLNYLIFETYKLQNLREHTGLD